MAFNLFTSDRLENLLEKYVERSRTTPGDPLRPETIVVQSQGMAQWLREQLTMSRGDATHVEFPFVSKVMEDILGADADSAYFSPDVMTWRIFSILNEKPDELAALDTYLGKEGGPDREIKAFQLAGRVAHVFDQYQIYRPDMLLRWEGKDGGSPSRSTGEERLNPAAVSWQRYLWRRLTVDKTSRPARFAAFFADPAAPSPSRAGLSRLAVFGISALPPVFLTFFNRLSESVEVDFFYVTPCRGYWLDQIPERDRHRLKERFGVFRLDENFSEYEEDFCCRCNPLLANLGRQGREFFAAILDEGVDNGGGEELFAEPAAGEVSLLEQVREDILESRSRDENDRFTIAPDDSSVQIHICHSRMREVEILHDNLLTMIDKSDGAIQPRDILITAPDIADYAPYVDAVFGQGVFRNMYSVADKSVGGENQVVAAFLEVLALLTSDFKASAVLDTLEIAPVRETFGIERTDFQLLKKWLREAGARWGVDGAHRQSSGQYAFDDYSWRRALKRMLLGMAMMDDGHVVAGDLAPYDAIEGNQADLLGKLVDFVEALFALSDRVKRARTLSDWQATLTGAVDTFFGNTNETYEGLSALREKLAELSALEKQTACQGDVGFHVISDWLAGWSGAAAGKLRFLKGKMTFCTLQPMRSVPAKVMCLMGMNDGDFPRIDRRPGFDVTAAALKPCDRSKRFEDRYLFLEALMSARQVFHISYLGRGVKDNAEAPPATPVCELIDYITQHGTLSTGGRNAPSSRNDILAVIQREHRLQAFHPVYFSGADPRLKSYSRSDAMAAAALRAGERSPPFQPPDLMIEVDPVKDLELDDLERFFSHPCEYYLRHTLGVNVKERADGQLADTEPFTLDTLEAYGVNQDIFDALLSGASAADIHARLRRQQLIEAGAPGARATADRCRDMEEQFIAKFHLREKLAARETIRIVVTMDGITLAGTVAVAQDEHLYCRYANVKGKDILKAWLRHLLINCERPVDTIIRMKNSKDGQAFASLSPAAAKSELSSLLAIFAEGRRRPLPFFCESAYAYATKKTTDESARVSAAKAIFRGGYYAPDPEENDPAISLCFPDGETAIESADFAKYARMIFKPVAGEEGKP
ncbi:MAG: exodeoxyribonuclease V subunit gamma [Lentisphaeria bacterium]|nr:exodeoxyribonuclease V subunit gamma [Lentisphaeria bacterium]